MKYIIDLLFKLFQKLNKEIILYFHNDPLVMKDQNLKIEISFKYVIKLFLIVIGQKKIFEGLDNNINSENLSCFQVSKKKLI